MTKWKECSEEIIEKMKKLNINKEYFIQKYNVDIIEVEAMLSGETPYDEIQNYIASDFLERSIDCSPNLSNCKLAFRKDKNCSSDDIILRNKLEALFQSCIEKDGVVEKVDTSGIRDIRSFVEYFDVSHPITIEEFIKKNKNKDNFVLIKSTEIEEISGASARFNDREFIYINTSKPLGRQIFTFFHELYHIYFELADNNIQITKHNEISYHCENKADKFSSQIIIDREKIICQFLEKNRSRIENIEFTDICQFQQEYNCTFQCIMYCIQNLPNWIENNKLDCQLINYIPKIPAKLLMYYNEQYWGELREKIKDYNCNIKLNEITNEEAVIKSYII